MNLEEDAVRQLAMSVGRQTEVMERHLTAQTSVLERLVSRVEDVDRRVIRLEEAGHGPAMDRMRADIENVEREVSGFDRWRSEVNGAMKLFNWVFSIRGAVIAGIAVTAAYFRDRF